MKQLKLLNKLNPEQLEAVTTTEGPLLIIAGAGSGKTRVLTHRIAYILDQHLAIPEQILAVTFTNKAAGEMKERIGELINNKTTKSVSVLPWCGTFHSICVRILRKEGSRLGLKSTFTIYDSTDSLDNVKQAMDDLLISKKDFNPYAIRASTSSAKNELITPEAYINLAQGYFQETVARIYVQYQSILRSNQASDFDDLIMLTTQLFANHSDISEKYRNLFRYIHVDEYQDTNHAQYILIKQLAKNNICVVGDDDQSIYGFRGATIQNILNFEKDYPETKVIKLEQNYRSSQNILDASHSIVHLNQNRRDKKLWTDKGRGEPIHIHSSIDETDESNWVAERCSELIKENIGIANEIAVLYRTNAQSRSIEEAFLRYEIPYKIVGGIRFYDRKEVKDMLAYMRIVSNPADELSLKRIINTPRRGIGEKIYTSLIQTAKSLSQNPVELLVNQQNSIDNPKLKTFSNLLQDIFRSSLTSSITDFIKFLLDRSGYLEMLNDGSEESQARIENIQELLSVASKYDDLDGREALEQFLEDVSLVEQESSKEDNNPNAITLMTVHAAKGLEFKHVFVVGMEESLFPHSRSYDDPSQMEEERRLAYVALTRAKEIVYITHTEARTYFGKFQNNLLSRFIRDIPEELVVYSSSTMTKDHDIYNSYFENEEPIEAINVKVGDNVKHEIFGRGKVVDIDESTITIDFGFGKGRKELALEYARLEKI